MTGNGVGKEADDKVQLEASWKSALLVEFEKPYMSELRSFLAAEKRAGKEIFPPGREMFAALDLTPLHDAKVIIIGQDPYHGPNQAHGLCFSVRSGVPLPPSLVNIFKEISAQCEEAVFDGQHGCLTPWANQGVLLLNSVLTVERGRAASHQGRGWEIFTDAVVSVLNEQREHLVFLLWGSYAQKKGAHVDRSRHCVLAAPHPSPLSAHRGFFGCNHFNNANAYLEQHAIAPINWLEVA
jgi:uracil-DNA glycosylase